MRGLAYLLAEQGSTIIGYDDNPAESRCSLETALVELSTCDYIVYTDATTPAHPLRESARTHSISEYGYHQALGKFSQQFTTLAVTGTHGKSSTTAFLAHILITAGLDPTILIGASMPTLAGKHAQLGKGKYFVVEADEYRNHFYELSPSECIITSIDFDHPDAFTGLEDVEKSYEHFMSQLAPNGTVFVPDTEYTAHQNISWPANTSPVPAQESDAIRVLLPGKHMRQNASLAIALAEKLGIDKDLAIQSLTTFPGLARRFELLGRIGNVEVRSDYGHHPAEITATLQGAREFAKNTPIIAIFEAHMPKRLHTFFDEFAKALALADEVIITTPFIPTGRDEQSLDDAYMLQKAISAHNTHAECIFNDTALIESIANKQPSIAILFSAGTLDGRIRALVNNH